MPAIEKSRDVAYKYKTAGFQTFRSGFLSGMPGQSGLHASSTSITFLVQLQHLPAYHLRHGRRVHMGRSCPAGGLCRLDRYLFVYSAPACTVSWAMVGAYHPHTLLDRRHERRAAQTHEGFARQVRSCYSVQPARAELHRFASLEGDLRPREGQNRELQGSRGSVSLPWSQNPYHGVAIRVEPLIANHRPTACRL